MAKKTRKMSSNNSHLVGVADSFFAIFGLKRKTKFCMDCNYLRDTITCNIFCGRTGKFKHLNSHKCKYFKERDR